MKTINHILSLLLVAVLLMTIAVRRDKSLFGHSFDKAKTEAANAQAPKLDANILKQLGSTDGACTSIEPNVWQLGDGTLVYSSLPYGKDITGYSGPTPVFIAVGSDGKIRAVVPGSNSESPDFFKTLSDQGLFAKWNGMTLSQAAQAQPDAVSGATYSSTAVIKTVALTAEKVAKTVAAKQTASSPLSLKNIIALLVLLSGVITAFFIRGKKWRIVQLVLNVAVLGFWTGSFLSMQLLVGWLSHGVHIMQAIVVFVMLLLAVLLPLFTKRPRYYCYYVCPFGSAQELLGKAGLPKWKIPAGLAKVLRYTQRIILLVILVLMWTGWAMEAMDYEAFPAFIFNQAGTAVLIIAGVFLLLSLFINRPYCHYVCPTGQLYQWSEGIKIRK